MGRSLLRSKQIAASILMAVLLVFSLGSCGNSFSGKCIGVSDGDTITVLHAGKAVKIRLYGVDCPEKGQYFWKKAKQFTSEMAFGKA